MIIITGESVPRPFVTIASRCVQIPFKPLAVESIVEVLTGEGVESGTATSVAEAAGQARPGAAACSRPGVR